MRRIASSCFALAVSATAAPAALAGPDDGLISAEMFGSISLFQSSGQPEGATSAGQGAAASGGSTTSGTTVARVDDWEFRLTPYMWISAMNGSASVQGLSADFHVTIDDILRNLDDINFAGGAHFEASKDKWTIFGDANYLSIGGERWYPNGVKIGLNFEQGLFEVGGAYELVDMQLGEGTDMRFRFEPLAGVRVYTLHSELSRIDIADHRSRTDVWVDVMGGGRVAFELTKGFDLYGRFDLGGAPNSWSWNAIVGLNWQFCSWAGLDVGWRCLSIDKTSERGSSFEFDVLEYGPFLGVQFRF